MSDDEKTILFDFISGHGLAVLATCAANRTRLTEYTRMPPGIVEVHFSEP